MKENKQWSEEKLFDFEKRVRGVTIPVNIQIESRQVALDLTRANQILIRAEKIAIGNCNCRATLQNCDLPRNTCIFLNKRAEFMVERGQAKWITQEQANNVITETHKQGLIHLAMYQSSKSEQFPFEICSCCTCCCVALQGLKLMNMKELVKPSEFIATFDQKTCNKCGICVERCQFGAKIFDSDNNIIFRQDLCFGCGLCVTTCPVNAIQLTTR